MPKPALRKPKKKANPLKSAKVANIDYKDTATLRKFISDRGKIRARRVTGVTTQEQRKTNRMITTIAATHKKIVMIESEADQVIELARREMCGAYDLEPPLEVDAGAGPDWLSAK